MQLLGLTGTLGTSNPTPASSGLLGNSVLGPDLSGTTNARNFTFTGINYTINIAAITDSGNNPAAVPFTFSRIDIQSASVAVNSAAATPEPAPFALCGAACVALGLIRCRHQSAFHNASR